jgi:hypothetical protein
MYVIYNPKLIKPKSYKSSTLIKPKKTISNIKNKTSSTDHLNLIQSPLIKSGQGNNILRRQ